MPTRYVFWRTPDGKPYRGTDGKYAPQAILASLGERATLSGESKVQWEGFNIFRVEPALRSAITIVDQDGHEINDYDSWMEILRPAITSVIRKGGGGRPALPSDVIAAANKRAADYFRKPVESYTLVTSLSLASLPSREVRIGEHRMRRLASRGRYKLPEVLERHASELEYWNDGPRQLVAVHTQGRTVHEAMIAAMDALDLLRGLWTLLATYRSWSIGFGPPRRKPLGIIGVGPTHTLHSPDGQPAGDMYWHDSSYVPQRKPFAPESWTKIERTRRWAMRRLASLPHGGEIRELLVRYANALDHADYDTSLLQMWSMLEKITGTIGANYDETIERVIWGSADRAVAKEKLQCVRLRRNQVVHSARSTERQDQVVYLIKSFVDPHLIRLIRNDLKVSSLAEYASYLTLPGLAELKKQASQRRRAVRILRPVEANR